MITPLPDDFRVVVDPDVTHLDDHTLFGGSPARAMRLTPSGRIAWSELQAGPVRTRGAARLGRQLTDAGLAHPRPPLRRAPMDISVVVPVRDRADLLEQCLSALGAGHPVVVVDDGSVDPDAVAAVAAAHSARLIVRAVNGGPAAARNSGLIDVSSEFVALVDSDCVPPRGWIDCLGAHFADPNVGAVAPRIIGTDAGRSWIARFTAAAGSLDMGEREARVEPRARVSYVPSAAMLIRRSALLEVAGGGDIFDPVLRFGEDVDLVWRLHAAGWRIRYDPSVQVAHREPRTWRALLARRFRYGTSAAPLAERHPAAMHPVFLPPWPTLAVVGLLVRRPGLAAAASSVAVLTNRRRLRAAEVPTVGASASMLKATALTGRGLGRYCSQFGAPVLAAALIWPSRARRPATGRRLAAAALWFGPPLATWFGQRPPLDPARFVVAQLADDIAYGAGVWTGCLQARSLRPLRPQIPWPVLRTTRSARSRPAADARGTTTMKGSI